MIIRFLKNRIVKLLTIFFIAFLLYLFPSNQEYKVKINKVINENKYHEIYLLDNNKMLTKTNIVVNNIKKEDLALELIEILKINGKYNDRVPNGFKPILNENLKVNNILIDNNKLIIDFNEKLFLSKVKDETILESIIYTLTSIKGIDIINISINKEKLLKLPKSNKLLDENLNRSFGINKEYNIDSIKDITNVTIYYNERINNETYYVPVTKYINNPDNKIKIIIDELSSRMTYSTNLISYLNSNIELLNYDYKDKEIDLNFNEYLFDNKSEKKVLEEVIYSISYSIKDTLNIDKVNFYVKNKEIKMK